MDKSNFKKMALMGMAVGLQLVSQPLVNADTTSNEVTLAANGCGGGACGGARPRSMPYQGEQAYYQSSPQQGQYSNPSTQYSNPSYSNPSYSNPSYSNPSQQSQYYSNPNTQQQYSTQTMPTLSENELLSQLSPEARSIYDRLSPEGKALALRLASNPTFRDKAQAVKAAADQIRNNPNRGY